MKLITPVLIAASLLAACGTSPSNPGPETPAMPPSLDPSTAPNPAPNPTAAPRELTLIPGDLVQISVYRQADLDIEVRIPQEGTITFPLIGTVEASGRTARQLEKVIRDRLAEDYLHDPQVMVAVKEYAKRKIYIFGGVQKPGSYEIPPTERVTLIQFLATAGGFSDRAYKEFAQIVRRKAEGDREVIRLSILDVERAVARGNAGADIDLCPDDLVIIPSAARVIYVLGAVKEPGSFDIPTDAPITVSMAVSRAGSYTRFAATGRVQVIRHTPTGELKRITVDLDAVLGSHADQDAELLPGDVVYVPERGIF